MSFFKIKKPKLLIKVFIGLISTNLFFYILFSEKKPDGTQASQEIEMVIQAKSFTPTTSNKLVLLFNPNTNETIGNVKIISDENPNEEIKKVQISMPSAEAKRLISKIDTTLFYIYPNIEGLKLSNKPQNIKKGSAYEIIF
jgi:hypothetical protein